MKTLYFFKNNHASKTGNSGASSSSVETELGEAADNYNSEIVTKSVTKASSSQQSVKFPSW